MMCAIKPDTKLFSSNASPIPQISTPVRSSLGFFEALVTATVGNKLMDEKECIKTKTDSIEHRNVHEITKS